MKNILNIPAKEIQANIEKMYTGNDKDWYNDYNEFLHKVANKYELTFFQVVGIFTVYSTNAGIDMNLKLMHKFLNNPYAKYTKNSSIGLTSVYIKAVKIYESSGTYFDILTIVSQSPKSQYTSAYKLRSFYINLCFPNCTYVHNYRNTTKKADKLTVCTIDRHAICLAVDNENIKSSTKNVYAYICKQYAVVSKKLNITPQQLQASSWIEWRKVTGKAWYSQKEKQLKTKILA